MPKICVSPSAQEFNHYVDGGNEEYYMNLIADAMEPYLRASGIDFDRNQPEMPLWQNPQRMYEPYRLRLAADEQALLSVREKTAQRRAQLNRLYQILQSRIQKNTQEWDRQLSRASYELQSAVQQRLAAERTACTQYDEKLKEAVQAAGETRKKQFLASVQLLDALSPLSILSRGYGVVLKDGASLRSVKDAQEGDELTVRMSDGELITEMKGKKLYEQ